MNTRIFTLVIVLILIFTLMADVMAADIPNILPAKENIMFWTGLYNDLDGGAVKSDGEGDRVIFKSGLLEFFGRIF